MLQLTKKLPATDPSVLCIMKPNYNYWPAFGWTILILLLTLAPGKDIPSVSFLDSIPDFDKVVHATLFFGFVVVWGYAIMKQKKAFHPRTLLLITLIAILSGIAIEFVQLWWKAIHRDFELLDMAADAVGALLGAWVTYKLRRRIVIA